MNGARGRRKERERERKNPLLPSREEGVEVEVFFPFVLVVGYLGPRKLKKRNRISQPQLPHSEAYNLCKSKAKAHSSLLA